MSEKPYEVRWGILGEFFSLFLFFSVAGEVVSEVFLVDLTKLMDLFYFFFPQQRAG